MNINILITGTIAVATTVMAGYAAYVAVKDRNDAIALAAEQAAKMEELAAKVAANRKASEEAIAKIRAEADASKTRSEELAKRMKDALAKGESIDSVIDAWKKGE